MTAGRKKLPDAIKKLRGTSQPCRMSGDAEVNSLMALSDAKAPAWLPPLGKKIYKEKARQLISIGVLTELDCDLLAIYANSFSEAVNAIKEINANGRVSTIHNDEGAIINFLVNPYYNIYKENIKIVNQIATQFGMSPSSRASILAMVKNDDKEKDDFEEFE